MTSGLLDGDGRVMVIAGEHAQEVCAIRDVTSDPARETRKSGQPKFVANVETFRRSAKYPPRCRRWGIAQCGPTLPSASGRHMPHTRPPRSPVLHAGLVMS